MNASERRRRPQTPDDASSVGWTEARLATLATAEKPFVLESGATIGPVDVEYETYGELAPAKDNVILIAHALSGDAHAAGWDKNAEATGRLFRQRKPGWWDTMIGPGKPIDTRHFFVLCSNVLGSCYGTTSPASINPSTGKPYGLSFPVVSVEDWVKLQARLLERLGIERLYAVIGGSLGGQQALEGALRCPGRVEKALVLAASSRLSTQGLAFNAVGRYSIMHDPAFNHGDYYGGTPPEHGLAAARMLAHITYLSDEGMVKKFGRRRTPRDGRRPGTRAPDAKPGLGHGFFNNEFFGPEFEVESYLDHQGRSFVERFDANSYLYVTRAMDHYDAAATWGGGDLTEACGRVQSKILVASFSSDWLYLPAHCRELAFALTRRRKAVSYADLPSAYGHDAFLIETEQVGQMLRAYLSRGQSV
jgi:homoserine O-acetyltransferase